jgi:hypothetical protein
MCLCLAARRIPLIISEEGEGKMRRVIGANNETRRNLLCRHVL